MSSEKCHSWNVSPAEAIRIQTELIAPAVRIRELRRRVRLVGGADLSFSKDDRVAFGGFVVWDMLTRQVVERAGASAPLTFPYVPGLLTFREAPALLAAWAKLKTRPDVLMFDGSGYAHPRRCGLASHMGVLLDVPSIGVAKSRLCGHAEMPGPYRGSFSPWFDGGEQVGWAVRSRERVKPIWVSPGHRVSLSQSVEFALACCTRYRLPEPTRLAHQFVAELKSSD